MGRLPVLGYSAGVCRLCSLSDFSMVRAHVVNNST
ncbi:hypothetical protein SGPA1_21944 [Streptomyces misionensis JCM 4497]